MILQCAIYCSVIDNFGDVGVCWRLARQLADEYNIEVTLWVDDLISFAHLAPSLDLHSSEQSLGNIRVCLWHPDDRTAITHTQHQHTLPDLLIEGFGCRILDAVKAKMAQQAKNRSQPLWINLEYLTAESWAIDCHAMPSLQPETGLVQHFWFPGMNEKSGGLLREVNLLQKRDEFQNSMTAQLAFWSHLKIVDANDFDRKISLFSYENNAIPLLLDSLATDEKTALLIIPEGKVLKDVSNWAEQPLLAGDSFTKDSLTIVVIAFLDHDHYDQLLWSCDLNFVRGEDSFVRAQWAGKPFIWHIYPQDRDAHLVKLNAFMDSVSSLSLDHSWRESMLAWNSPNAVIDWKNMLLNLNPWQLMTREWQAYLTAQPSLTRRLMQFYDEQRD